MNMSTGEMNAEQPNVLKENVNVLNTPSCSGLKKHVKIKITPEVVRPYPKVKPKETKTKREPGKSRIYTDTPEKQRLEEIENKKSLKIKKVVRKMYTSNEIVSTPKNTKKAPIKKPRPQEINLTSSESDISLNDNSDDDISDELEIIKDFDDDKLKNEDFVLVRFPVKHTMIHFVGQILSSVSDATYRVKFLRRKGLSTTFYFPNIEDITSVDSDDILAKLTTPLRSGTARTSSYFQF
ncbi:hypothetical protein RI129_002896 [Pyrocoelia pectoralis]|uniref:Uncharacterized protein n=1 Tax=Pyrocoelia pectoralis TaxID=417401 RepID=A0AAN7VQK5_9COLE